MKKTLITLACLAIVALAGESSSGELSFEQRMLEQQIKGLRETTQIFMDSIKEYKEATPKKIEAFKNGERLFCKNQIVTSKKGWLIEGDLLIKDDHYYLLADCFLNSK